jgi:uncharacterized phage infection (PIP) family protein YhgE
LELTFIKVNFAINYNSVLHISHLMWQQMNQIQVLSNFLSSIVESNKVSITCNYNYYFSAYFLFIFLIFTAKLSNILGIWKKVSILTLSKIFLLDLGTVWTVWYVSVICTDCIGSCKSYYHTITTTTAPKYQISLIIILYSEISLGTTFFLLHLLLFDQQYS